MTPGVLYLLGAPLQLSQRVRTKHSTLHRLGRVLLASGLLNFPDSFAAAFWIAFSLHVLAGDWWIRTPPAKSG
jgi:hypothetical protein